MSTAAVQANYMLISNGITANIIALTNGTFMAENIYSRGSRPIPNTPILRYTEKMFDGLRFTKRRRRGCQSAVGDFNIRLGCVWVWVTHLVSEKAPTPFECSFDRSGTTLTVPDGTSL